MEKQNEESVSRRALDDAMTTDRLEVVSLASRVLLNLALDKDPAFKLFCA